jgi:hypothetical protein
LKREENAMPKKKTGPGRPFKAGNPGGPGRPPKSKEEKAASKLTRTKAEEILNRVSAMGESELTELIQSSTATVLEKMVARVCEQALSEGDQRRIDWLFDRLIGKVKEVKEIQLPTPTYVHRFGSDEVIELGSEMVKELPAGGDNETDD